MAHKSSLPIRIIFILYVVFSFLFSALALPSTRSLKSNTEEIPASSVQDLLTQDAMDLNGAEELVEFGKMFITNGRMDLESTDYPGTGANNHHDPKTPGRA